MEYCAEYCMEYTSFMQESCLRVLLFRGANKEILNYSNQSPYECAILAGNNAIAEILEGHKDDDVGKAQIRSIICIIRQLDNPTLNRLSENINKDFHILNNLLNLTAG